MHSRSNIPSPLAKLPILLALGSLACVGDDEPSTDPDAPLTLDERIEELSRCEPTDLEYLVQWSGPAFDPETGALLEPLPDGHVEALVNGWAIRDDEALELRIEHATNVLADLYTRDGFLGFESVESVECDIAFSHSLWRDEAAMYEFVVGGPHAAAMSQASKMHHAVAGAHWTNPTRTEAPTWQEGLAAFIDALSAD